MLILFLLVVAPLVGAGDILPVSTVDGSGDGASCVCNVHADWSELTAFYTLRDMRTRLGDAESLLDSMNFPEIFEQLNNITHRLNHLEKDINGKAVATSVTELFALRKNVEMLVALMENTNSSSLVSEQRARLEMELETITNVTNDMWARNPYKQKEDYKQEVAQLRDRFSRCQKDANLSPFAGDSLPVNVSMSDDWCAGDRKIKIGYPVTHKWEKDTNDGKGMWFKDPEPLDNSNTTAIWEIIEKAIQTEIDHRFYRTAPVKSVLKRFSDYSSLSGSGDWEMEINDRVRGYGAIIYRNSLYYHSPFSLIKVDLNTRVTTTVTIGFQEVNYGELFADTVLDLKVDELGLWLVYVISSDNKIAISSLDPDTLHIKKTWLTDVIKSDVCAAFMTCGRLYTVKSCNTRLASDTRNYVYDIRTSRGSYSQYHIASVYGSLRQLTYNPRERQLFGWDNNHLVTYYVGWEEAQ